MKQDILIKKLSNAGRVQHFLNLTEDATALCYEDGLGWFQPNNGDYRFYLKISRKDYQKIVAHRLKFANGFSNQMARALLWSAIKRKGL